MKCRYVETSRGDDLYNVEVRGNSLFPEFLEVTTNSGKRMFVNKADIFKIYPDDNAEEEKAEENFKHFSDLMNH